MSFIQETFQILYIEFKDMSLCLLCFLIFFFKFIHTFYRDIIFGRQVILERTIHSLSVLV
jgi:hypothetical protein